MITGFMQTVLCLAVVHAVLTAGEESGCRVSPGMDLPGLNATLSLSAVAGVVLEGTRLPCQCNHENALNDYVKRSLGGCQVVCQVSGNWDSALPTLVPMCSYRYCMPEDISRITKLTPDLNPDKTYVGGDEVFFKCETGFILTSNVSAVCSFPSTIRWFQTTDYGEWSFKTVDGNKSKCELNTVCPSPPDIENAKLVSLSSTQEGGEAVYRCDDSFLMNGDGVAKCQLAAGQLGYYYYQWLFLPTCAEACPVPVGNAGNREEIVLVITSCVSTSFSPYTNTFCENPVKHTVNKMVDTSGSGVIFYGEELCVAVEVIREKRQEMTESTEKQFCFKMAFSNYAKV